MHSEDSDQTGWMPRMIRLLAGRTVIFIPRNTKSDIDIEEEWFVIADGLNSNYSP